MNQLRPQGVVSETAAGAAGCPADQRLAQWLAGVVSEQPQNKAVEFRTRRVRDLALRTADGRETGARRPTTLRILFQPEDAVLGSSREAELLRADMRRQLVESIIRRPRHAIARMRVYPDKLQEHLARSSRLPTSSGGDEPLQLGECQMRSAPPHARRTYHPRGPGGRR